MNRPVAIAAVDWSGVPRTVVAADGAELACWHRPADSDRWVLWVHGAGADHRTWGRQLDAFAGWNHLFVDLRGHGASPLHHGRRAAFADVVADLGAVLDAFAVDRAVLVGHSWGGNPAQGYAYRHPDRAAGLALVGTWGQLRPMPPGELRRIKVMTTAYRAIPWRLLATVNSRWCTDDPATRQFVTGVLRGTRRDVFVDLGLSAYQQVRDIDTYPDHTPTLLVRGALDAPKALTPIYAAIRAKNPAAREVVIDATRHMPMIDTADQFNTTLATFLASLR